MKPIISNKIADATFVFAGATVTSPVIDTRSLDSNVLIKSGDTLAIGGLLQDEVVKSRTKVPMLGDVPVLGYLFSSRANVRTKRNLLVFVTPTVIDQRYGTGLEDQVSGLHHSGEEYADPNGWRNNAMAVRARANFEPPDRCRLSETGHATGPSEGFDNYNNHDGQGGVHEQRQGSRLLSKENVGLRGGGFSREIRPLCLLAGD